MVPVSKFQLSSGSFNEKKNFSFFFNYLFCFVIINNSAFEPLPNFSVCVQIFKIDSEQVERIDEDFEVFFSYTYLS